MTRPATNSTRRKGTVRCAVYTRKSSEEGLEQEFNSLQAQREACEAFITSQRHEGWGPDQQDFYAGQGFHLVIKRGPSASALPAGRISGAAVDGDNGLVQRDGARCRL